MPGAADCVSIGSVMATSAGTSVAAAGDIPVRPAVGFPIGSLMGPVGSIALVGAAGGAAWLSFVGLENMSFIGTPAVAASAGTVLAASLVLAVPVGVCSGSEVSSLVVTVGGSSLETTPGAVLSTSIERGRTSAAFMMTSAAKTPPRCSRNVTGGPSGTSAGPLKTALAPCIDRHRHPHLTA